MRLVLETPYPTPSLNEFANRGGRWRYASIRRTWVRRMRDAWYEARIGDIHRPRWDPPPRARLVVERFTPQGATLDPDNLVGGLKPVIDALRIVGLIAADTAPALELITLQPANPYRTPARWSRFTIEPIED